MPSRREILREGLKLGAAALAGAGVTAVALENSHHDSQSFDKRSAQQDLPYNRSSQEGEEQLVIEMPSYGQDAVRSVLTGTEWENKVNLINPSGNSPGR